MFTSMNLRYILQYIKRFQSYLSTLLVLTSRGGIDLSGGEDEDRGGVSRDRPGGIPDPLWIVRPSSLPLCRLSRTGL